MDARVVLFEGGRAQHVGALTQIRASCRVECMMGAKYMTPLGDLPLHGTTAAVLGFGSVVLVDVTREGDVSLDFQG